MLNSFRWLGKHQLEFPHLTPRYLLQDLFTNLLPDCQGKLVLKPIHHLHFHDFEGRVLICKLLLLLMIQKFGRLSSYLLSLIVFPPRVAVSEFFHLGSFVVIFSPCEPRKSSRLLSHYLVRRILPWAMKTHHEGG